MDVTLLNLNKSAVLQAQRNKNTLRVAYKKCGLGDLGAREFVKEYIKDMLRKNFNIDESNIDKIIPFYDPIQMQTQDKYDILMRYYKRKFGLEAFIKMINKNEMIENSEEKG